MAEEWLDGLSAMLARPGRMPPEDGGRHLAAVMVLLARSRGRLAVVLTKRTRLVEHHKGEVSFPGGTFDAADSDLLATALRETHEELGVPPDRIRVLGQLPSAAALSHFIITPFVGVLLEPYQFTPNPKEVEEVFLAPAAWLLDPANRQLEPLPRDPETLRYAYHYHGHRVWGATARILSDLLGLIGETRGEEPVWRAPATSKR
ncbi:MAG: CoA pyrophosphatase [Dehalococcoidia bacterium]|nr:CoA pyrophosphatase [Dehalococcoidia bacterium]